MKQPYFFERLADGEDHPGGVTVSKTETLPPGDFKIDEYIWRDCTLWFITDHEFTDDERETCRQFYCGISTPRGWRKP